ncbi:MAG: 4'-phosphopantetheinyl transferase superfamily protein [Kiritimatiellia bacterium]
MDLGQHLRNLEEGAVVSYAFEWTKLPSDLTVDPQRLNETERIRYQRFSRETSRFAFLAGRCVLRSILELSVSDRPIMIDLEAGGKPFCPHPLSPRFNLSHSEHWLFVAFCQDQPLGVDVEETHRANDVAALTDRCFSVSERARVDVGGRGEFFRIWTRKEARLKASGEGLRVRLSDVDTLAEEAEGLWRFETVTLSDGVVASLCYAGERRAHVYTRC